MTDRPERVEPPHSAPERAVLTGFLDVQRAAVVRKLRGLSDEQARTAACPPSTLTPAGVVKHLTAVERFWFSIDFDGRTDLEHPWTDDDPHGAFPLAPDDTVPSLLVAYEAECERSREVVRANPLEELSRGEGMDHSLRWVVTHMIEETARHAGHLDLLREALDGSTGP